MAKVTVVSIDGLQPKNYLGPSSSPALSQLRFKGAFAESVQPVYPTVTLTNHVSLVTGVSSATHGVLANTRFSHAEVRHWTGGESQSWYLNASAIQSPTVWDLAREAGLKTAALHWPVTLGAQINYLVPEIFQIGDLGRETTWQLIKKNMDPALHLELTDYAGFRPPASHAELDDWISYSARHLIQRYHPDLTLVHLTAYDHAIHEYGTKSSQAKDALEQIESQMNRILTCVDLSQDFLIVLGDHGFMDFKHRIHLNALFAEKGFLKADKGTIVDWQAIAHTNCSQAPIYLKDRSRLPELLLLLHAHSSNRYRVLEREQLDKLKAFPEAACAIDALEGFSMGQNLTGPLITEIPRTRGEHGYLPEYVKLQTGLIALGPGIPKSLNLGVISLLDVAPTVASLLNLELPGSEGRILKFNQSDLRRRA